MVQFIAGKNMVVECSTQSDVGSEWVVDGRNEGTGVEARKTPNACSRGDPARRSPDYHVWKNKDFHLHIGMNARRALIYPQSIGYRAVDPVRPSKQGTSICLKDTNTRISSIERKAYGPLVGLSRTYP